MPQPPPTNPEDVEQLLLNARLRDELEPFFDESITRLNLDEMPTPVENEFLASILAWERAPLRPIAEWFEPELRLPHPSELSDEQLHAVLWDAIQRLYSRRIVLDFTDHLSDRQLYTLIVRDILPAEDKQIDPTRRWLHWDCADTVEHPEIWLRYYATDEERQAWAESENLPLPPREEPPCRRNLPRAPL